MSDATAPSPIPTETVPTPSIPTPDAAPSLLAEAGSEEQQQEEAAAPEPFDAEKLTIPDGFEKNGHYEDFVALATGEKLSLSASQKLIELYSKTAKMSAEASAAAWQEQNTKWQEEVKADQEVGGSNLQIVLQTVSKVMDNPELTDPQFREVLSFTGLGNHPVAVRTLYRWAKALSEGSAIAGNPPGANGQRPTIADALYPGGPRSGTHRME
jgi:hypothetical protein